MVGTQKAWDAGDGLKWWLRQGDQFVVQALINIDWVRVGEKSTGRQIAAGLTLGMGGPLMGLKC
jgi:hypothetical protein